VGAADGVGEGSCVGAGVGTKVGSLVGCSVTGALDENEGDFVDGALLEKDGDFVEEDGDFVEHPPLQLLGEAVESWLSFLLAPASRPWDAIPLNLLWCILTTLRLRFVPSCSALHSAAMIVKLRSIFIIVMYFVSWLVFASGVIFCNKS